MTNKDFFFGDVFWLYDSAALHLGFMNELVRKVSPEYFTSQLNRLLRSNSGRIVVIDSRSCPDFDAFLRGIQKDAIGLVEIYARTDVNSAVVATLACDLFLQDGIVSVFAHWCSRNEEREAEIVNTLLKPIHAAGLDKKTYLRIDNKVERALYNGDHESEINRVIRLSKTIPSIDIEAKAIELASVSVRTC
ncbi:MAG TPA: hypothetical protein PKD17_16270 [Cellvibrionaceae bacterium]|nr:hypothetical protein [Cellvibrionaceae bacterium]